MYFEHFEDKHQGIPLALACDLGSQYYFKKHYNPDNDDIDILQAFKDFKEIKPLATCREIAEFLVYKGTF